MTQVNAWLREKGVRHTLRQLGKGGYSCANDIRALLEALGSPFSIEARLMIAEAVFACGPNAAQKRAAMGIVLSLLKENAGRASSQLCLRLANLVSGSSWNESSGTTDNADGTHVHPVGAMLLDNRYGNAREEFTYVLRKIGDANAISYLQRAAKDPEIASYALRALSALREDRTTLALCEGALKLPKLCRKSEIEQVRAELQSKLADQKETDQVNAWLRKRGIRYAIRDLYHKPRLCPDCVPALIELLKSPISHRMCGLAAQALFARKPNSSQKQEAVDALLTIVRQSAGQYDTDLSLLVINQLCDNLSATRVHQIGEMVLDKRYGELREELTGVLWRIGKTDAVSYLLRAAKEPQTASVALEGLSQLRVNGTLTLCERALKDRRLDAESKEAIRETYSELKRQLAKKRETASHVTKETIPKHLREWSANLDGDELPKVLRTIQKCLEGGFAKSEISGVMSAARDLSVDQDVRLKFNVRFIGKPTTLWLEIFCDDEDAYDLYILAFPDLIDKFQGAVEELIR
jgi:hypothetical protein